MGNRHQTSDIRLQPRGREITTNFTKGEITEERRDQPRILEFITNFTKKKRNIYCFITRIIGNRHQTSDIRLQPRGERENHTHLNPLLAYAKALADRPSRARE